MPPSQVVAALKQKCPETSGRATFDLVLSKVRRTFACATIRASEAEAEAALAASVAQNHDASARATRMIQVWKALDVQAEETQSSLTWYLGTTSPNPNCVNASGVAFRKNEIAEAKVQGEDADHWLRVEAGYIAGACPDRLEVLFQTVIAAGQPDAVRSVRAAFTDLS